MGMYDTVHVPVELLKAQPDTRIQKYAGLFKCEVTDFQTKDLESCMQEYLFKKVDAGYLLHEEKVDGEIVKTNGGKSILDFYFEEKSRACLPALITETICLYDYYNSDTIDIVIDLKVKVVDGLFISMECIDYEERDPKPRIDQLNETMQRLKESAAYYKTFRGKLALTTRKVLLCVHRKIYKFNNWLQKLTFKL
jgi:hypothetical protein